MSKYEKISVIISIIALAVSILIPLIKFLYKRSIKAELIYHSTKRAQLYCNRSGSYVKIDGVYESKNKNSIINIVEVNIKRKSDGNTLCLPWSSFVSPVVQSFSRDIASTSETAHQFKVEADSITCAFIEFGDFHGYPTKRIMPYFEQYCILVNSIAFNNQPFTQNLDYIANQKEYIELNNNIHKELFWQIGDYEITIKTDYNNNMKLESKFTFTVSESDYKKIEANISELLATVLKDYYRMPYSMQPIIVELKEEK
jgi:hypothetical protein